jgi:hypothetical protein
MLLSSATMLGDSQLGVARFSEVGLHRPQHLLPALRHSKGTSYTTHIRSAGDTIAEVHMYSLAKQLLRWNQPHYRQVHSHRPMQCVVLHAHLL